MDRARSWPLGSPSAVSVGFIAHVSYFISCLALLALILFEMSSDNSIIYYYNYQVNLHTMSLIQLEWEHIKNCVQVTLVQLWVILRCN